MFGNLFDVPTKYEPLVHMAAVRKAIRIVADAINNGECTHDAGELLEKLQEKLTMLEQCYGQQTTNKGNKTMKQTSVFSQYNKTDVLNMVHDMYECETIRFIVDVSHTSAIMKYVQTYVITEYTQHENTDMFQYLVYVVIDDIYEGFGELAGLEFQKLVYLQGYNNMDDAISHIHNVK